MHRSMILAVLALLVAAAPAVAADTIPSPWRLSGTMSGPHIGAATALLSVGQQARPGVFVIGGEANEGGGMQAIELTDRVDRLAGAWTRAASLPTPRVQATATTLASNQILVAGGVEAVTPPGAVLDLPTTRADRYDPTANAWLPAAPMTTPRAAASAVRLADGRVLVTGGADKRFPPELYDPARDAWTPTGPLSTPRRGGRLVALPDGRALLIGGNTVSDFDYKGPGGPVVTVDAFDPVGATWSPVAPLPTPLDPGGAAITLFDGTVLLVAGQLALRYDPAADRWSAARTPPIAVADAVLLADGDVLAMDVSAQTRVAHFEPKRNLWVRDAAPHAPRRLATLTALPDGSALLAGGIGWADGSSLESTEVYEPPFGLQVLSATAGPSGAVHLRLRLDGPAHVRVGGVARNHVRRRIAYLVPAERDVAARGEVTLSAAPSAAGRHARRRGRPLRVYLQVQAASTPSQFARNPSREPEVREVNVTIPAT